MTLPAFSATCAVGRTPTFVSPATSMTKPCLAKTVARKAYRGRVTLRARADASKPSPDETTREDQEKKVERMRSRLEGLFGVEDDTVKTSGKDGFDGVALRNAIRERWGVQYDVQPQKRHGRVYVQIMWRYFEQQSFYMEEEEFACHCEAVAQLLTQWNAVDYFCDYISSIKKRPVVGITINIPIPDVSADSVVFE